MVAAYHVLNTDRIRYYTSLAGVVSDGFAVTTPAYKACAAAFAQNPAPPKVAIGRCALPPIQVLTLSFLSTSATDVYTFTLTGSDGVAHLVSVASTGTGSTDVATVNTAVTALSIPGCTATHATHILTLTQTASHLVDFKRGSSATILAFADTSTDPGIATDLAAITAADGTGWYAFTLDSNSSAAIQSAAAWAEANGKIFATNNSDSANWATGSTSNLPYTLQQLSLARTYFQHSETQLLSYAGMAMLGNRLPSNPGSDTWDLKTLAGVPADNLTETQTLALTSYNANFYTTIAGINVTNNGTTPSGAFVDLTRFIDWLNANIQIDVFQLLISYPKIAYTDIGIAQIKNVVKNRLKIGGSVTFGGIDLTQPYGVSCSVTAETVDAGNKNARNLPGVSWFAVTSGAIQSVQITGSLT